MIRHFSFVNKHLGNPPSFCHGTALVFIQWCESLNASGILQVSNVVLKKRDNDNIADFLLRATVLKAFLSQFEKAAALDDGTLGAAIDKIIVWAGLLPWSRRFLELVLPHSAVITRAQLMAWWFAAVEMRANATTPIARRAARRAHPVPRNIGCPYGGGPGYPGCTYW